MPALLRILYSTGETVNRLHDKRAIQWMRKCATARETPRCVRFRGEPGIPDVEYIITDHRDPAESEIEVGSPLLALILHEAEKVGARTERVLDVAIELRGRK